MSARCIGVSNNPESGSANRGSVAGSRYRSVGICAIGLVEHVIRNFRYISDEDVEQYFLAADVLVLPYKFIYQSECCFCLIALAFPLSPPMRATLARISFRERPDFSVARDPALAAAIKTYFNSELFRNLEKNRSVIIDLANEHYSWETVGAITQSVYARLLEHRQ